MKRRILVGIAALATFASFFIPSTVQTQVQPGNNAKRAPQTIAEFEELQKQVSNWGRWGKDDELGTMNLVTDAKRKAAASLVRTGRAISLAHTLITEHQHANTRQRVVVDDMQRALPDILTPDQTLLVARDGRLLRRGHWVNDLAEEGNLNHQKCRDHRQRCHTPAPTAQQQQRSCTERCGSAEQRQTALPQKQANQ